MQTNETQPYSQRHKPSREFSSRSEYLDHELSIMNPKRWGLNLPGRDFKFEIEDLIPAIAGTIGLVVMCTAVTKAFAGAYGLDKNFIVQNVRVDMIAVSLLFVILFSGLFNPRANLPGIHGPMLPLIPLMAASGTHPLALGALMAVFGIIMSITKGGSRLVKVTSQGVAGGLLVYLGAIGTIGQVGAVQKWGSAMDMGYIGFAVLFINLFLYAYLARVGKRWLAIPLCSTCAAVVALVLGAPFEFTTGPGLPSFNPMYWWGTDTGWKLGLPGVTHFIASLPFAILAVAMWSPDFLGHRIFQEMNYPQKARNVLMNVDDTMVNCSLRQVVVNFLGSGCITSSWGTYMIPAAIAKRPIPAGAILTGILSIVVAIAGLSSAAGGGYGDDPRQQGYQGRRYLHLLLGHRQPGLWMGPDHVPGQHRYDRRPQSAQNAQHRGSACDPRRRLAGQYGCHGHRRYDPWNSCPHQIILSERKKRARMEISILALF